MLILVFNEGLIKMSLYEIRCKWSNVYYDYVIILIKLVGYYFLKYFFCFRNINDFLEYLYILKM